MRTLILGRRTIAITVTLALALSACDKSKTEVTAEPTATASASAAPAPEPPPGGCLAGSEPTALDKTSGYVYDLAADATHLYYGRWQVFGGRGDLRRARKDGKGGMNLASLSLEPRGVVVDDASVYFTSGIRLMKMPKAGGESKTLVETFSSLSVTATDKYIYGVPSDYGPYDRLIRADKGSGVTYELDVSERPDTEEQPRGFSAVVTDAEAIYVTDSSGNRVLRFGLERAKPKVIAPRQERPFALGIDDANIYFSLALKGDLMKVKKSGGTPTKLAAGLVKNARIAVDQKGVFATLAGKGKDAPGSLVKIPNDGGAAVPMASVPSDHFVEVIGLDDKCLYWVERVAGSGDAVLYARAR